MKHRRLSNNTFLRYFISTFLAFILVFSSFATFLAPSLYKKSYQQIITEKNNLLEHLMVENDNHIQTLTNTVQQMFMLSDYTPFRFQETPYLASRVMSGLSSFNLLNTFYDEIFLHYTKDNYIYSSKSSYTETMFFEKAMLLSDYTKDEFSQFYFEGNASGDMLKSSISGYLKLLTTTEGNYLFFRFPIPLGSSSPYAQVLFMVEETGYRKLLSQNSARTDETLIYNPQNQLVISNHHYGLERNPQFQQFVEELDGSTQLTLSINDVPYHVQGMQSIATGYSYINIEPQQALTQSMIYELSIIGFLFLAAFLLGIVLFLLVSYFNYIPIKKLKRFVMPASYNLSDNTDDIDSIHLAIEHLRNKNLELSVQLTHSQIRQKDFVLLDLLKGHHIEPDSLNKLIPPKLSGCQMQIGIFHTNLDASEPDFSLENIVSFLEENIPSHSLGYGLPDISNSKIIMLIICPEREEPFAIFEGLNVLLEAFCGKKLSLGVGRCYKELERIPNSYLEARSALDYRHIWGNGISIRYEELVKKDPASGAYPHHQIDSLIQALKNHNTAKTQQSFVEITNFIVDNKMPIFMVRNIYLDIISFLLKGNLYFNKKTDEPEVDLLSISRFDSSEELLEALKDICIQTCTSQQAKTEKDPSIQPILTYTNIHFCELDFSVQELAQYFHLSMQKLINIFKAATGSSPLNYITDLRIDKAKHLLNHTGLSVKDIAEQVGYCDVSSFIRKFKSATGLTPNQYRKLEH